MAWSRWWTGVCCSSALVIHVQALLLIANEVLVHDLGQLFPLPPPCKVRSGILQRWVPIWWSANKSSPLWSIDLCWWSWSTIIPSCRVPCSCWSWWHSSCCWCCCHTFKPMGAQFGNFAKVGVKVEKSSTIQCVGTTYIVFDQVLPCFGCRRTISKYYCLTMWLFSDC